LETFTEMARSRRVIPVVRRLLADAETPVGVYRKLAKDAPGTFLLESAEHGGVWSRYSIVGAASRAVLTEKDGVTHWIGDPPVGVRTEGNPLEALRDTVSALATDPIPGLPPLTGGMVGAITYDAVRRWEKVPDTAPDELHLPELAMMLSTDLAVLDHADGSLLLVANAVNYDATDERVEEAWTDAVARLDRMTADLGAPAPSTVAVIEPGAPRASSNHTPEQFRAMVEAGKEAIRAGEVFQVVLSQRFTVDCPADALDVYRVLRASNPSPYMYLLRLPAPDGTAYHVAKERSEHVMLVDLSRNDLQRVCHPGTVDVVEFMTVRRYSHIMHLESTVVGDIRPERSAYDVLVATFPAGTLSGAPKPRAMALIDELEPSRRGIYGGVVGYLDFHGDLDMAIAIRTAVIKGGRAYVQAGGGIVADSVPQLELEESVNKAAAALRAVASASGLRTP